MLTVKVMGKSTEDLRDFNQVYNLVCVYDSI